MKCSDAELRSLPIDTPGGGHVPLATVAKLQVISTPSDITRVNGSNKIDVLANVDQSNNLSAASSAVKSGDLRL